VITQLATLKTFLDILQSDAKHDVLLTRGIEAVTARFDRECNRTLARTDGFTQEFPATDTEIVAGCYPIEKVIRFELKRTEAEGWVEQTSVSFVLRQGCVMSLASPLSYIPVVASLEPQIARVTYTGGYVMPGTVPGPGQVALPADLESAAIEQVAVWFQQRDKLGLIRYWPSGGTYLVFAQLPLLAQVSAVLRSYERWAV
jgi:hypothetical protein